MSPDLRPRILATEEAIRRNVRRTPVVTLAGDEVGIPGRQVTLKLELLQHSGSFKVRGAFANLALRQVPTAGVVAASGGNHGVAVAFAARHHGVPAKIFVPRIASPAKIDRIRSYGADLVVGGDSYAEALAGSEAWLQQTEALAIHAFDQEETILGQGTLGLELEAQAAELDTVLVGVGGGGLLSGIASWYGGRIRLVGVEPEGAPTLTRALEAGGPVDAEVGSIAADSLAPRRIGERNFPILRDTVAEVVLVSDADIRAAQRKLWELLRVVAEPGGAAAFSALLSGKVRTRPGERVGIVVSGGNTSAVDFER
ncbi:MAG TPA: threonine/serine dehydratase [Myxococcaceae bacterium]|nr:threonine/serine dehydratase [Myxococcaceae bacterium]